MLVVIPWRDTGCEWRRRAYEHVTRHYAAFDVVATDAGGDLFSRSDSLNEGARGSDADVICALDADIIIPPAHLMAAAEMALDAPGMVLPFTEGRYLGPSATLRVTGGASPWLAEPRWRFHPDINTPLVGGCNVLSRETFEAVGGWPTGFFGWGNQDIAFADMCEQVAPLRRIEGPYVHLHHPKTGEYVSDETKARNAARLREVRETL